MAPRRGVWLVLGKGNGNGRFFFFFSTIHFILQIIVFIEGYLTRLLPHSRKYGRYIYIYLYICLNRVVATEGGVEGWSACYQEEASRESVSSGVQFEVPDIFVENGENVVAGSVPRMVLISSRQW